MVLVSLVVASLGRSAELDRLFASLAVQTDGAFEVVLVDQNRDARLHAAVARYRAAGLSIEHLRLQPPNLSAARNLGIRAARGAIVAFPDDDCWFEPDTVAVARAALAANARLDGIAGCWLEQQAAQSAPAEHTALSYARWWRFRGSGASSITLFLRRALLASCGGFDERLGVGQWYGAGEETDLLLRLLARGARILPCPQARVHHALAAPELPPLAPRCRSARSRGRGTGAVYAKHGMGLWVVLRGLAGQTLRPLLARQAAGILPGLCASLGALEGLLRWRLREKGGDTAGAAPPVQP